MDSGRQKHNYEKISTKDFVKSFEKKVLRLKISIQFPLLLFSAHRLKLPCVIGFTVLML
jgi:hypothetical protein